MLIVFKHNYALEMFINIFIITKEIKMKAWSSVWTIKAMLSIFYGNSDQLIIFKFNTTLMRRINHISLSIEEF